MTIDPLRLAESGSAAAVALGAMLLPAVVSRPVDARLVTVLAMIAVILTSGVYALHAVTFDCFRLTGQRAARNFSYTRSEE